MQSVNTFHLHSILEKKADLTIDDFILHLMQLTYDLVQNFLHDKTCVSRLNINFEAGATERFNTDLLHPVKLCVGFTGAADGPHSETQKVHTS